MRHPQHGLTLVELMVGMAIGLVLTAIALFAMTQHLKENHRLLLEARLTQDFHATLELLSRDLRRAGPIAAQDDGSVSFSRDGSPDELRYRLQDGVVSMKIGDGHWQALTDGQTLRVSALRILPRTEEIVLDGSCSKPCDAAGTLQCPPRQQLRHLQLEVTASAVHDANWTRTATRVVKLQHDTVTGACPT